MIRHTQSDKHVWGLHYYTSQCTFNVNHCWMIKHYNPKQTFSITDIFQKFFHQRKYCLHFWLQLITAKPESFGFVLVLKKLFGMLLLLFQLIFIQHCWDFVDPQKECILQIKWQLFRSIEWWKFTVGINKKHILSQTLESCCVGQGLPFFLTTLVIIWVIEKWKENRMKHWEWKPAIDWHPNQGRIQ